MTDKYLRNIIEEVCKAAQENNIGICEFIEQEDTETICETGGARCIIDLNRDSIVIDTNSVEFTLNRTTCFICNGYYGPCFDDPLCSTCHAFLYPNQTLNIEIPSAIYEPDSDSDSGNDEELDDGQESLSTQDSADNLLSSLYEFDDVRSYVPIGVETLAIELQRLSEFSPSLDRVNIELLPPEVLMHMFEYLDEISLWSMGQVCSRWKEILFMCVKPERWRHYTLLRWPLLPLMHVQQDWYELYTALMLSACCLKCVKLMASHDMNSWEENSWRRHRLNTEVRAMRNDPLDGIDAKPLDHTCGHWQATIEGPSGSPYEGGLFFLYIQVPSTYPLHPPVVRFITKIFHPNVSRHGDIGIDSIYHNWSLALTISKLLISIQSLLTDPFCEVCMEPAVGEMYMKNRKKFEEYAKLWTIKYAMHDLMPH